MNSDIDNALTDKGSVMWIALLFLGLGLLFGWGIGGDRKEKAALDWAVETTRRCEASYRGKGDASVADCLQRAIDEIDDEKAAEAQAEGRNPR